MRSRMSQFSPTQGTRRTTKACARCRKRKIKCDFGFPSCGTCVKASAECMGFDVLSGIEAPRSTVAYLESQIAQLEIDLARIKSSRTIDVLGTANSAVDKLTARLVRAIGEPWSTKATIDSVTNVLSLASPIFISQSPLPIFASTSQDRSPSTCIASPTRNPTLSSIPRHVIDIMLKNYCQIYLSQYPAVDEASLYESCDRIYADADPSSFDIFSVAISLAISATTLIRYDEERAMACAADFWNTAAEQLPYVGGKNTWQRLQALQLLAHYGLLSPKSVNCCNCASAATRLCVELGLHRELSPSERGILDPRVINTRRRLFWTSYSIDAALHSVLCRPFIWPNGAISAEFPEPESGVESSPAARVWPIRQIESEIITMMYYPSIFQGAFDRSSRQTFQHWSESIQRRLEGFDKSCNNGLTDSVSLQTFRLNRPSPRILQPTSEMRVKAISTVIALTTEYGHMERSGSFFYIWYAAHYLTELNVTLLDCIIAGLEDSRNRDKYSYLDGLNLIQLMRTIRTFPLLFSKIASRWPEISQHASTLEEIARLVLQDLEARLRGDSAFIADYSTSKWKLARFLCSPETLLHGLSSVDHGMSQSLSPSLFPAATPQCFQLSPSSFDCLGSQSGIWDSSIGANADWDSGGLNLDQIFAALLGENDLEVLPT